MTRFLLLAVLGAMSACPAGADDYPYLTFQQSNGTTVTMPSAGLTFTIADGKLVAKANDGATQTFTLADLSKMYFSATAPTSIETAEAQAAAADGPVEAYTLAGTAAGTFDTLAAARKSLPKGIYIVKQQNGSTLKISIR